MDKIKVIKKKIKCTSNGTLWNIAHFADDHSNEYGIKYFITEDGEVAVVNLLDGIPPVWEDIKKHYTEELSKWPSYLDLTINDVWRFCADRSINGKVWYLDQVKPSSDCFQTDQSSPSPRLIEVLEESSIFAAPQPITFNNWEALSSEEKRDRIQDFFRNPIRATDPIRY